MQTLSLKRPDTLKKISANQRPKNPNNNNKESLTPKNTDPQNTPYGYLLLASSNDLALTYFPGGYIQKTTLPLLSLVYM